MSVEAKPIARYRRRAYTWDALQYDGANGADVVAFVGGLDYGAVEGDKVVLSLQGKSVQSQKLDVLPGQWVLIPIRGGPFNVVSDGEFNMVFEEDTGGPLVEPAE